MNEYLFEKEIRIFGMKRSGNTTALYFLWGHFDLTNAIHIQNSNLSFHSSNSLKKRRPGLWIGRLARLKENKVFTNGVEHLPIEYIGMALNPHYCYYAERKKQAIRCGKREFSKDVYNIVLIRSPHNHLASVVKKKNYKSLFRGSDYYIEFGDLWVQYAKEALSITNHIPNKIPVLFDRLVDSVDYRKSISDALGFVHNDFRISLPGSAFSIENGATKNIMFIMNVENWFKDPVTYDHDEWGGFIMQNQEAMAIAVKNGYNVFSVEID